MGISLNLWRSKRIQSCLHLKRWLFPCTVPVRAFSDATFRTRDEVIGIDLGTTYSRVAILDGKVPSVVNSASGFALPSYVAITSEKKVLVGRHAKFYATECPESAFFKMKHLIGMRYDDPRIEKFKSMVPYRIVSGSSGEACIEAETEHLSPALIYSHILRKMKEVAEGYAMKTVSKAVIAVPAYFNAEQIKQVQAAGQMAELEVLGVIEEPTASAFSSYEGLKDGVIAVLDFGGGTFDVSILKVSNTDVEVKARGGDEFLGGEDFDNVLVEYLVQGIKMKHSIDVTEDRIAMMRLKDAAEKAKMQLSFADETFLYVDYIGGTDLRPVHVDLAISRAEFETLVHHLFERIRITCRNCLTNAGTLANEIHEVILVGGMAKVPVVRKIVEDIFQKAPIVGEEQDESVASGAAIMGGILIEDGKDSLLENVAPLSIGVETLGGIFTPVIDKNTRLPTNTSFTFTTEANDQQSMLVRILQGEREMASDNRTIGELELKGLPPAAAGATQVVVNFDLDVSGVLSVWSDQDEWFQRVIKIKTSSGLSREYIRGVVKDALLHGKLDMQRARMSVVRKAAEVKMNKAEGVLLFKKEKYSQGIPHDLEERIKNTESLLADSKAGFDSVGDALSFRRIMGVIEYEAIRVATWGTKDDPSLDSDSDSDWD